MNLWNVLARFKQVNKYTLQTVLENRSFSRLNKYGKKVCVIGDGHLHWIMESLFINSLSNGTTYFSVYEVLQFEIKNFVESSLIKDNLSGSIYCRHL